MARGVGPQHAARIRNEYKYIERTERQSEKETLLRRGEFARVLVTSESYTHRCGSRTLARSFLLPHAGPALAYGPRPVPLSPHIAQTRGPAESQSMLSVRSASARPVPVERRTKTPPLEGFNARRVVPHINRVPLCFPAITSHDQSSRRSFRAVWQLKTDLRGPRFEECYGKQSVVSRQIETLCRRPQMIVDHSTIPRDMLIVCCCHPCTRLFVHLPRSGP